MQLFLLTIFADLILSFATAQSQTREVCREGRFGPVCRRVVDRNNHGRRGMGMGMGMRRGKGMRRGGMKSGEGRQGKEEKKAISEAAVQDIKNSCKVKDCLGQPAEAVRTKQQVTNLRAKELREKYGGDSARAQEEAREQVISVFRAKKATLEVQGLGGVVNPIDNGLWEGDMALTKPQADEIAARASKIAADPIQPGKKRRRRSAYFFEELPAYKWSLPINYQIRRESGFSSAEEQQIRDAIDDIQTKTCVQFRESGTGNHLRFYKYNSGSFCGQSPVGNQGSYNAIYLNMGCANMVGVIAHEILHSLGIHHTQTRVDRDDYLDVQWDNIDPQNYDFFAKADNLRYTTYGVPYDYYSVMHYRAVTAALKEGTPTLVPKMEPKAHFQEVMGRREGGLSSRDAEMVRKMYCQPNCKDIHVWCGYWQSQGYCRNDRGYFKYMTETCAKSCELC